MIQHAFLSTRLVHEGSNLDDSEGILFCELDTFEGPVRGTFLAQKVTQSGDRYFVPIIVRDTIAQPDFVVVEPEYEPFRWGVTQRPPMHVTVRKDLVQLN